MGKLINRIPGLPLLKGFQARLGERIWIAWQASRCQQAFSKPCLVNLISKDTHQVFSIFHSYFFSLLQIVWTPLRSNKLIRVLSVC